MLTNIFTVVHFITFFRVKKLAFHFIVLLLLFFQESAFSQDPVIGPELVFKSMRTERAWNDRWYAYEANKNIWYKKWITSRKYDDSWQRPTLNGEAAEAKRFAAAIMHKCPDCNLTVQKGKFNLPESLIEFPNKYWIVIGSDPSVVELQTPELPLEKYKELAPFIQEYIYDVASSVGFEPQTDASDGHSNIGVLSAFENVTEFAAFILDQVTHPELALGILGKDLKNAPPLAIQKEDQIKKFYSIIEDVKNGKIQDHKELADRINHEVYYQTYDKALTLPSDGRHYQAVSLKHLSKPGFPIKDAPMEIRNTAARTNFYLVLLNYELLLKRIEFVKAQHPHIGAYKIVDAKVESMDYEEKLSRFYIFVTEMGLDFEKYRPLIFDPKIAGSQLDGFVRGKLHFKEAEWFSELFLLKYVNDLELSSWVRNRMKKFLSDPETPYDVYENIIKKIDERLANLDPLKQMHNKANLLKFKSEIESPDFRIFKSDSLDSSNQKTVSLKLCRQIF